MRIVISTATYWPNMDGVQMVTQYHAEGLINKGHEVYVITSELSGHPKFTEHNGVKIIRVDAKNKLYWHFGNKNEFRETILKYTENADAFIAVCLQSFAADWILDFINEIKCKKILYLHGMPDFKLHKNDFISLYNVTKTSFRNIRWWLFYKANWAKICKFDGVVHLFNDDNSYRYFKKNGYENNIAIENSCDSAFFYNINSTKQYFLYVGNYCQRKNQMSALRSFYKSDNKDFGLIMIGSHKNKYYKSLVSENNMLQKKYGKRKVQILASVSRNEIIDYIKSAYVTIMSSTYEYYPIVIVESMAAGIPFISTNVGVVRLLPGGVIVNSEEDMTYWMNVFSNNLSLRNDYGKIGSLYAKQNLYLKDKVDQLEAFIGYED